MMKEFLPYDVVRNDALKLAHKILKDDFIPDVIYCSLRGGAYMANVISEYFKIARKGLRPVMYSAVVARSYTDIRAHDRVMIDGWTYSPEHLRPGDKILLIDLLDYLVFLHLLGLIVHNIILYYELITKFLNQYGQYILYLSMLFYLFLLNRIFHFRVLHYNYLNLHLDNNYKMV